VHVDDAAEATARALASAAPGVYHVVDDEPIVLRDLLRAYARTLGAPAPRRIPRIAGRMAAGAGAVYLLERLRGASNAKARRALGWQPRPLELVSGGAAER
jgi:nucleoside-diphosphate-sugar epimerase